MIPILDELIRVNQWPGLIIGIILFILVILRYEWDRAGPSRKEIAIMVLLGTIFLLPLISAAMFWDGSNLEIVTTIVAVSFILFIGIFYASLLITAFGTKKRDEAVNQNG